MVKTMENKREGIACVKGSERRSRLNEVYWGCRVSCWLIVVLRINNADVKAILEQSIGGDQPREIVSEYQDVACHMDGAKCRVKNDRNQIPVAMLKRWNEETRVRGPKTG